MWAVADLADPLGARWLAELPFDVANLMFWESGYVPGVLRVAVGGGDGDVRRYLSAVHRQYFGTVDFAKPYYGRHAPGDLYGNEFDSTLLCPDYAAAASLLGHLVALHLEETRFARAHLERTGPAGSWWSRR